MRVLLCAIVLLAAGCAAGGSRMTTNNVTKPAIQVVVYPSGLTGFFDPEAKTLYLYASDLKTPFATVHIDKLGEELKLTQMPTSLPR